MTEDLQRMKIMGPFILKIVTSSAATDSISDLRIKILRTLKKKRITWEVFENY